MYDTPTKFCFILWSGACIPAQQIQIFVTAAHHRKAQKPEYLQIVAELNCLGFSCEYHTVQIGCLGLFLKESISAMKTIMNRKVLDKAAAIAISLFIPTIHKIMIYIAM